MPTRDTYQIAEWLHEEYESISAEVGWDTQDGTTVPFDELPDKNREVMIRLAGRLQSEFDLGGR